jgi:pilus assembly protein CpaB
MKPAQIVLLLVALLAGGLAAFLATRGDSPAPQQSQVRVAEAPKVQVLVAKTPIGMAERLTADNVEWQNWPEGALRPDYVTNAAMPDAPQKLAGSVARFEFFAGEPIRDAKLVHVDQGYLSAVLDKGKRGVSIPIDAASGSGGFIVPNDRVDVVLTRSTPTGHLSETILSDVKVLAIGHRLGELGKTGAPANPDDPKVETFSDQTIATLELDPGQGETLVNAAATGQISLALRSVADFNDTCPASIRTTNQPVRVIRYGQSQSVIAGSGGGSSDTASVAPAAVVPPPLLSSPIEIRPSVGPATDLGAPVAPPAPPAEPVR